MNNEMRTTNSFKHWALPMRKRLVNILVILNKQKWIFFSLMWFIFFFRTAIIVIIIILTSNCNPPRLQPALLSV